MPVCVPDATQMLEHLKQILATQHSRDIANNNVQLWHTAHVTPPHTHPSIPHAQQNSKLSSILLVRVDCKDKT